MTPLGDPIRLEVTGTAGLAGTATLTYPVPTMTDGEVPVVATWDGTEWVPVDGTYDPATGLVTATTTHFSWWRPFGWNIGKIVSAAFAAFFGDVDTSAMPCDAPTLTDGYRATLSEAGAAFSGCARVVNGDFTVTLKNRRRGAFSVELPSQWSRAVDGASDFSAIPTNEFLNLTSRKFVVIPGGESATISGHLEPGQSVSLPVEQDMFTWSLDTLLFLGQVVAVTSGYAGASDTVSSVIRQTGDQMNKLRDAVDCLGRAKDWLSEFAKAAVSQATAQGFLPAIWKCAGVFARENGLRDVLGALVGLVITPVLQIWKLGEMAGDALTGKFDRRLDIVRDALPKANDDPAMSTAAAAARLRSASVPSMCEHPAGVLVDGELPVAPNPDGSDPGFVSLADLVAVGDTDGDGRNEIAAVFDCSQGGVAWPEHIVVYRDDLTLVGEIDTGSAFSGVDVYRDIVQSLTFADGRFVASIDLEVTSPTGAANSIVNRELAIDVQAGELRADSGEDGASASEAECANVPDIDDNGNEATRIKATGLTCSQVLDLLRAVLVSEGGPNTVDHVSMNGFDCDIAHTADEAVLLEDYICVGDGGRAAWHITYGE